MIVTNAKHLLARIYTKIVSWASHPRAILYLLILSFLEACVSPVTPMIVLLPMVLASPQKMWRYILLATMAATVGSMFGYGIGSYLIQAAAPWLIHLGYWHVYLKIHHWFHDWGVFALLPTSFLPLPYKLFSISAGALGVPLMPFLSMTILVRCMHFSWLPIITRYFSWRKLADS